MQLVQMIQDDKSIQRIANDSVDQEDFDVQMIPWVSRKNQVPYMSNTKHLVVHILRTPSSVPLNLHSCMKLNSNGRTLMSSTYKLISSTLIDASELRKALPVDEFDNLRDCLIEGGSNRCQILQEFLCGRFVTVHDVGHRFYKYCRNFQDIGYISNSCTLRFQTLVKTVSKMPGIQEINRLKKKKITNDSDVMLVTGTQQQKHLYRMTYNHKPKPKWSTLRQLPCYMSEINSMCLHKFSW